MSKKPLTIWGKVIAISLTSKNPTFTVIETEKGFRDRIIVIDFDEKDSDFIASLFNKFVFAEYLFQKEINRRIYTKLELSPTRPEKQVEETKTQPTEFVNNNQIALFS